jgi:hypothetical protein
MPKFHVTEERAYKASYLIEAENEDAARQLSGEILDSNETDSWGERLLDIEEVSDDEEFAPEL